MIELKQYSVFCEQGVRGNNEDFIYPATAGKNDRIFVLCVTLDIYLERGFSFFP